MNTSLSPSAQKVQEALNQFGLSFHVVELPGSTRSAQEAASAIGCAVGQIAKSLIFRTKKTARPVLVIASGANRVNERHIGGLFGEKIGKADAAFVRAQTGFAIGGVPPAGHIQQMATFIDRDLMQYEQIWAAAGTPHAVFQLAPQDLVKVTGGQVVAVT